jgi:hypothetical protein
VHAIRQIQTRDSERPGIQGQGHRMGPFLVYLMCMLPVILGCLLFWLREKEQSTLEDEDIING